MTAVAFLHTCIEVFLAFKPELPFILHPKVTDFVMIIEVFVNVPIWGDNIRLY